MDTKVSDSLVGTFVIILIAAIVLGIIWLSSGFSVAQYTTYQINMQEAVTGLNIDSSVEYNGVNVGSVKSIELNNTNPQWVELLVNIKKGTPVTRGTIATLTTKGLTGIAYVSLKDKSADLRPLVVEKGASYPVIKTAPSIFVRLDTALSSLSTNLQHVATSIQSVLDKDNQQSLKETLLNLKKITGTLANDSEKLTQLLNNSLNASKQFQPMLQSGNRMIKILETQTLASTYELLTQLGDATRNLSEVTSEIKENPSVLIRGVNRQSLGPGEK
jgi:phospholipid/cholesterol/gamma-HCH transport system substrate-binding protein